MGMLVEGDLSYAGISVVTVLSAGIGAYIGAYLKKKGENLATHEDLGKLVKEMEATTNATKRIEAQISNEVWDRQRQWELKRDTVVSAVQAMDAVKDALMSYAARREGAKHVGIDPKMSENVMESMTTWTERSSAFEAKRAMAALICGKEFNDALWKIQQTLRGGFSKLFKDTISTYDDIGAEIRDRTIDAIVAARNELGIPEFKATSPPTGSSAVPTPDSPTLE